jgi:hypothetical protein
MGVSWDPFSETFDRGFVAKHDLEEMLEEYVALRMYTDSKCIFHVLTERSMTAERRLQIDIALAKDEFQRNWITDVALVSSADNLADGLT